MRKTNLIIILGIMSIFLFNCGGAPGWYMKPPRSKDAYYGSGQASKTRVEMARQTADARARDAVARTIELRVSNLFKNFMQESGVGVESEALEFTSSVSKQVVHDVMRGCKIIKREVKEKGKLYQCYSLAEYDTEALINETKAAARHYRALYNEAKANMNFEELEEEIEKLRNIEYQED